MSSALIIPGLPDEVALCILARLPRILQARLRLVCRLWKDAMVPASLNTIRKMLSISEVWPFFVDQCMCIDNSIVLSVIVSPLPHFSQDAPPPTDPQQLKYVGVPPPPQLQQHRNSFEFEVLGVVGSEVLLTALPLHESVDHFQGIYLFDAPSMRWRDCVYPNRQFISNCNFRTAVDPEGGYMYVASGNRSIDHVDRLDFTRGMWEALPNPHKERECAAVVVLHGCLYMIGGLHVYVPGHARQAHSSGEVWDPSSREWTLMSELWPAEVFKGEMCTRAAVVMDQLYALRGHFPQEELMHYQTSSKIWISLGILPTDVDSADEHAYKCNSSLSGMGHELWVFDDCTARLATKPTLAQPLVWRVLSGTVQDTFRVYDHLKYIDVLLV